MTWLLLLALTACGSDFSGGGDGDSDSDTDADSDSDTDSDSDSDSDTDSDTDSDSDSDPGPTCTVNVDAEPEAWIRKNAFDPCDIRADPCNTLVVDFRTDEYGQVIDVSLASGELSNSDLSCIRERVADVCFTTEPSRNFPVPLCE